MRLSGQDSNLSDADFLNLICRESGAGLLLDIENLYLNSQNHDFDAYEFLDNLSPDLVREVHMAGGIAIGDAGLQRSFLAIPIPTRCRTRRSIYCNTHCRFTPRRRLYSNVMIGLTPRAKSSPTSSAFDCASINGRNMHRAKGLLDRQVSLLEYLTSGEAIFGDSCGNLRDPILQGIDRRLLDIEARFSHEKRMDKIAAVFPMTLALLGEDRDAAVREFVHACPPVDIGRLENARQFSDFLISRWGTRRPALPYLPDVTACELACVQVRMDADSSPAVAKSPTHAGPSENPP